MTTSGSEPAATPAPGDRASVARSHRPERSDDPVLPDRAAEDRDESWGDERSGRDDEWYRRERPPHHE